MILMIIEKKGKCFFLVGIHIVYQSDKLSIFSKWRRRLLLNKQPDGLADKEVKKKKKGLPVETLQAFYMPGREMESWGR